MNSSLVSLLYDLGPKFLQRFRAFGSPSVSHSNHDGIEWSDLNIIAVNWPSELAIIPSFNVSLGRWAELEAVLESARKEKMARVPDYGSLGISCITLDYLVERPAKLVHAAQIVLRPHRALASPIVQLQVDLPSCFQTRQAIGSRS